VFLSGNVTGVPDWRAEVIERLKGYKVLIFNPRCGSDKDFVSAEDQIRWEFDHLQKANILVFWFAKGSDSPMTLFEYGRYGINAMRPVFVGADKEYSRRSDVLIQMKLANKEWHLHGDLGAMIDAVKGQLVPMPKYEPGKQLVEIHRFRNGNQGQISKEGELELYVCQQRLELSTFRMCCSDYLMVNNILFAEFLGKKFLLAYEKDGVMLLCKGDGRFQISLAGSDPQWCRKCGAEVSPPGCTPGPVCKNCCIACR